MIQDVYKDIQGNSPNTANIRESESLNLRNEIYDALRSSFALLEEKCPDAPTQDELRSLWDETDKRCRGDQFLELERLRDKRARYRNGLEQLKRWLDSTSERARGSDGTVVIVGALKPGESNSIKTRRMIIWVVYDDRDWEAIRTLPFDDVILKVLGKRLLLRASNSELVARAEREQFRVGAVVQATKGTARFKILATA